MHSQAQNNQFPQSISLTTKKRSAKGMVPPPSGKKDIKSPWCPPVSARQDFDRDTLLAKRLWLTLKQLSSQ